MKLNFATACAIATLAMTGSAFAEGVTATLANPVATPVKFIAAHAVFHCEGTTCVAPGAPDDAGDISSCRDLAKHVGRVATYKAYRPLNDKAMDKCNAGIDEPKLIGTASR
jgi:hypothetical protein